MWPVGLSGKSRFDWTNKSSDDDEIENMYAGNLFKNGTYKRFDFGAGAKAGFEVNGNIQIIAGYEMSFVKPTKGL